MEKYAVIVAGGSGMRMGTSIPKQFLLLRDKPVLWYSINTFLEAYDDLQIIVVLPPDYVETGLQIIRTTIDPKRVWITTGGETRFHSVKNGLAHIKKSGVVFVHDGVRCLLTPALIRRCYEATVDKGNAIPSVGEVDTIRVETVNGNELMDRNKVRRVQTPQTFFSDLIKAAFEQDYDELFTDEANVVERLGVKINLIEGEASNIKITHPVDLLIAEKILEEREVQ